MTPKEKAEELFTKFSLFPMRSRDAKRYADFCVKEIISSDENEHPSDVKIEFWEDVIRELEGLYGHL